jgi:hypothetical protein
MLDIEVGDIVEYIPEKSETHSYWIEGRGLVLAIDETNIKLLMFYINRISKKNLTTVEQVNKRADVPISDYLTFKHLKVVA